MTRHLYWLAAVAACSAAAAPAITHVYPAIGPAGSQIAVSGTGLSAVQGASLGGTPASFIVQSDLLVYVFAPPSGSGVIMLSGPTGSASSPASYTVIPAPVVSGVSPTSGARGTNVVISGANLGAVTSVKFKGVDATFTATATRIDATVPAGATNGPISVTAPSGAASSGLFTVNGAATPVVSGFAPASGGAFTNVLVTGSNFTGVFAVKFNGVDATQLTVLSDTELRAQVPPSAATGLITVFNSAGVGMSAGNFMRLPAPSIPGFSPDAGMSGRLVTLSGSNLAEASFVTLSGVSAPFSATGTSISAAVPSGATSGPWMVFTPGGFASSAPFSVLSAGAPAVSGFAPIAAPVDGVVVVSGSNFTGTSLVTINGTAAPFTLSGDRSLSVTVPAGATSGPLRVTNTAGSATATPNLTVLAAPTVTSLSVSSGPAGTAVTVQGTSLGTVREALLGGVSQPLFPINATSISLVVTESARSGPVTVVTEGGSATSAMRFTVTALGMPVVSAVSPGRGAWGSLVTLNGNNFGGATGVQFGGATATELSVSSNTVLTARVPVGAVTGPVTVFNDRGQASSPSAFAVIAPPVLLSFMPASAALGDPVTLTGVGFTGATSVQVGGASASFLVDSDTRITLTVPPGAVSGALRVEGLGGVATSSTGFTVTSSSAPVVLGFTPTSGAPGTRVTLVGGRLTGVTAVRFGSVAAVVEGGGSDVLLTVKVPEGASSGAISVVNSAGTGASPAAFTVLPPAAVTGFSPSSGGAGTQVVITGTNLGGTTSVQFARHAAAFSVDSPTQLTALVPSGATSGPIAVDGPSGFAQSAGTFVVTASGTPVITGFTPAAGGPDAGVVLTGSNFTGATAVTLAGAPVDEFIVLSDAQLALTTPAIASSGPFTVWSGTQSGTSAASFTVLAAPRISGFFPPRGAPGATVTLDGANLLEATAVRFNGAPASFTPGTATQLLVQVPAATSGLISIETPAGTAVSPRSFIVDAVAAPAVSGFLPMSGGAGTVVRLTGSNFSGASDVQLAGRSVPFVLVDDLALSVTVPSGAATGAFRVVSPLGAATSAGTFTVMPAPALTGLQPSSGAPGAMVTLSGSDLSSATRVEFGGGAVAPFSVGGGQLIATVPAAAQTGPVRVVTPGGSASSTLSFSVTSAGAPAVTGLTPSSGAVGSTVVVSGAGLTGAHLVTVGATPAAFKVLSGSLLVFNVPVGAATGSVSVFTATGSAASAGSFTVLPTPVITSFSPLRAAVGATVDVRGAELAGATAVTFAGTSAAITSRSATLVRVTVPLGAANGPIAVSTAAGTAVSASAFEVVGGAPAITGFAPTSGRPFTVVDIAGSGFTGAQWVKIGGVATGFALLADSLLQAEVPPGGSGPISVGTSSGVATSSGSLTVLAPPVVSSLSITEGPVGAVVQLGGSGFQGATRIDFGGVPSAFTVASDNSAAATVPGGALSGPISVTTPGGAGRSTESFTVTTTVPPAITAVAPASGGVGTRVSVTGSGFSGALVVTLNGAAVDFQPSADGALSFTVPAGAVSGRVGVVGPAGTATSSADFTVLAAPRLFGFAPASGPLGTVATVSGTGLAQPAHVMLGGRPAAFTAVSNTELRVTVPAGATTGPLVVTTATGAATSAEPFFVLGTAAPTVSGFSPTLGGVNAVVTVTGTGFTGATAVTLGGVSAPFTGSSDTTLRVTVPAGAASGPIAVFTSAGTGASAAAFTVVAGPFVGSFFPASGTAAVQVTVFGRGFTGASAVRFNGISAAFTVASDTQLTATVPFGATTGPISVVTPAGPGSSAATFQVLSTVAPAVTSLTPGGGPPGAIATVRGSGFAGTSAVAFNGAPAAAFTVLGDTQLSAEVPAGATTGPVRVTNTVGTAASAQSFIVGPAPLLTGLSPASGRVGAAVTLMGSALMQAQGVTFNGVPAVVLLGGSDTQVLTAVPVGATRGPVSVSTPTGSATSAMSFTVEEPGPPTVSSVQPSSGPVDGGTVVQVRGMSFESGAAVSFGGRAAQVTYVDATTLSAVTPPSPEMLVDVVVTNPDGGGSSTLAGGFTYVTGTGAGGGGEQPKDDGGTGGSGGGTGGGDEMKSGCGCAASPGWAWLLVLVLVLLLRRRARPTQ